MNVLKRSFLVAYDYGMGGLWGIVVARSQDEIASKYPELKVLTQRPQWMSEGRLHELEDDPYDIDQAPRGILRAIISDRREG